MQREGAGEGEALPTAFEAVAAAADGAVAVVDDDLRFSYVSDEYADLHGCDVEDLLGERLWACYTDAERERLESEALPDVASAESWSGSATGRRTDGTRFAQDLSLAATDRGTVVVCRDLSDPIARHREFDLGEAFVESAFESIPDPVYAFDTEGRILRWNDRLSAVTGYDDRAIVEMSPLEFVAEADRDRVATAIDRVLSEAESVTIEAEIRHADGTTTPFELSGSPIEDASGRVLGFAGTARNVAERRRRERELERYETLVERMSDVVYSLDEDGVLTAVNPAVEGLTGYEPGELLGRDLSDTIVDDADEERSLQAIERLLKDDATDVVSYEMDVLRADGTRVPTENRIALLPMPDGEFRGTVGVVRDITERKRREEALERQRDELATLNRINGLIQAVIGALLDAASREEVERTVCNRLAASDLYAVALVAERDPGGDGVRVRTGAGDDGAVALFAADGNSGKADGGIEWYGPGERAIHDGTVQVVRDLDREVVVPDAVAHAAADHGVDACLAVPLRVGETVYSALIVGATRPGAFSEREQAGFEVLGDLMGFAIHAAQNERLLHADAVLELEFEAGPADSPLARLSERLDTQVDQRRAVPRGDDKVLHYVELPLDPDEALEHLRADEGIGDARVVSETENGCVVELVAADSAAARLTAAGATVGTATATNGSVRIFAEVPPDIDLRQVVEAFEEATDSGELLAKREVDHAARSLRSLEDQLDVLLTDRQLTAAQAAYAAGYFDWPRESTAEEVADSLGVTSPTLHQHLRKAEKTLFETLFGDTE